MSKVTVSVVLTTVGYTSRFNGNGRTTVRPYNRYSSAGSGTDALPLDTPVRPYSRYTSSGGTRIASEMSEKLEGV